MKRVLCLLAFSAFVAALAFAADVKLDGVKCPVSGKPAVAAASAGYEGGKVYFCCNDCKASFEKDPAKYAAKANHQLVATGQAKQASCPISGEPIKNDKSVKVSGATVYFCCDNCKDKVAKATGDEQVNLAFGDAAWKKGGFKVGK
jgi:YHS domain-containing protein